MSRRVLFVTPEIAPLNKVGGLGDVSQGLVEALRREGADVRVLMPGYAEVKGACRRLVPAVTLMDDHGHQGCLLEGETPLLNAPVYVADFPHHFHDCRSPYGDPGGGTAADARRFAAFARAGTRIALGVLGDWRPDVVHCNDWTTGLIPALLSDLPDRPATVFTIHNLAHQGLFPRDCFDDLGLPEALWRMEALEFYGRFSFMKGGLVYADVINTVSPTYAAEILTPEFGCGLEGLLAHRRHRLSGILNGIDYAVWNPAHDANLARPFSPGEWKGKDRCKADLQQRLALVVDKRLPLVGLVARLTHQKGIDLLARAWSGILDLGAQIVVLGSGDPALESTLTGLAGRHPGRSAVVVGYDEALAHRIIAGADAFLMPSRFEPCGLTQMYSLRYGTVPVAARTGGLVDTIVHADPLALAEERATGFLFPPGDADALLEGMSLALAQFDGPRWRSIQTAAMGADFGWARSARRYGELYEDALSYRSM